MGRLLAEHSWLRLWASRREGDLLLVGDPSDGCLFETPDGRCGIELRLGRENKPLVCRQFPFGPTAQVGATVVVSPHLLCPLALVVPADPDSTPSGYEGVLEQLTAPTGGGRLLQVPTLEDGESASRVIGDEIAFRDACAKAYGKRSFVATLERMSSDPAALREHRRRVLRLLGETEWVQRESRDFYDDALHALAPWLRTRTLYLAREARLRVLVMAESLVRRAVPDDVRPPTLISVRSFLHVGSALFEVPAWTDSVTARLFCEAGSRLPDLRRPSVTLAGAALRLLTRRGVSWLSALEEAAEPLTDPIDVALLLQALRVHRLAGEKASSDVVQEQVERSR